MTEKQIVKNEEIKFVELKDLTPEDVKKLPRFATKLKRTSNRSGLSTSINVVLNPLNLIISLVSSEIRNGKSYALRYFKPDRFVALIRALELRQKDEKDMDVNEWVVNPFVRFVKGSYKDTEGEYHSIEIIFKQYKYHVHFLTSDQLFILEDMASKGELIDAKGKKIKLNWEVRPEAIDKEEDAPADLTF